MGVGMGGGPLSGVGGRGRRLRGRGGGGVLGEVDWGGGRRRQILVVRWPGGIPPCVVVHECVLIEGPEVDNPLSQGVFLTRGEEEDRSVKVNLVAEAYLIQCGAFAKYVSLGIVAAAAYETVMLLEIGGVFVRWLDFPRATGGVAAWLRFICLAGKFMQRHARVRHAGYCLRGA